MPHEKIISGDLDGDGVEGHRKKITGGEFPRGEEKEHDFGPGPEQDEKRDRRQGRSKIRDSDDLFYTGFGSENPNKDEVLKKKSVIGDDSDIFNTGFGSATQQKREKMVHVTGSPEKRKQGGQFTEKREEKSSSFSPDDTDDLFGGKGFDSPVEEPEKEPGKKKERKMSEDPFYTGFGYTDQRGRESPADGGLFPEGDTLPKMPERELVPEPGERTVTGEPEHVKEIEEEKPKISEKPKKSSVLTRNDDDLFS